MRVNENMKLEAQVLNVTPDGCYNLLVHVTHVSTGTFLCGDCDEKHLRVTIKLRLTELCGEGREPESLVLNLCDDDALTFAHEVAELEHFVDRGGV